MLINLRTGLSVLMMFALAACVTPQSPGVSNTSIMIETSETPSKDYDVYVAALASVFGEKEPLVVIESTSTDYFDKPRMLRRVVANAQKKMPALSDDIVEDFLIRNRQREPLESGNLAGKRSVQSMTQAELAAMLSDPSGWQIFRRNYPAAVGVVTVSKVGYDSSGQRGFLYLACQKSPLDGFGYYLLLERDNDGWVVADKFVGWNS